MLSFWKFALGFSEKKAQAIKVQNTGEKQQFTWTNKLVDDSISSLENFKALRSLKESISTETDKHDKRHYRKNYVKHMKILGQRSFSNCKLR